jgi:hypothetical protein
MITKLESGEQFPTSRSFLFLEKIFSVVSLFGWSRQQIIFVVILFWLL